MELRAYNGSSIEMDEALPATEVPNRGLRFQNSNKTWKRKFVLQLRYSFLTCESNFQLLDPWLDQGNKKAIFAYFLLSCRLQRPVPQHMETSEGNLGKSLQALADTSKIA